LKFTLTAEQDPHEPNNDCDSATPIALGEEVTAQFIRGYASQSQKGADDWYKLDLAHLPSTLTLLTVPSNGRLVISRVNSSGVVATIKTTNTGEFGPFPFTPAADGTFCIHFAPFASTFAAFASGAMPSSMRDSYSFRIDQ
jgi:hypothetical protein